MKILAIKYVYHDTGAAVIDDSSGDLRVHAISEARLCRDKHSSVFPFLSIDYCMRAVGARSLAEFDVIAIEQVDARWPSAQASQVPLSEAIPFHLEKGDEYFAYLAEQSIRLDRSKVMPVHHIDAHAASAYFPSPFDEAVVLSVEGGTGIYRAQGNDVVPIDRAGYYGAMYRNGSVIAPITDPDAFGNSALMYTRITKQLGFGKFDAGKTMALASFGHLYERKNYLQVSPHRFLDFVIVHNELIHRMLHDLPHFGAASQPGDDRLQEFWVNLARQGQEILEEDILYLAELAQRKTGATNLCLAGGVALSCITNRKIIDTGLFKSVFIQPAASDEGIPLGCALAAYHAKGGSKRYRMDTAYLGAPNPKHELSALLTRGGFSWKPATVGEVAEKLASGKIVARCFDGSEYGPRALGNRSILADPRRAEMTDILNRRVKKREAFRPFAPSCHLDKVGRYFDLNYDAPFMIVAAQVLPDARAIIPAVTHIDGSARPQTVSRAQNKDYYDLIDAFGMLTGVFVLLNTSFNDNSEPIVESYADALISFLRMPIDYLYADGLLVERPGDPAALLAPLVSGRSQQTAAKIESLIAEYTDPATWSRLYDAFAAGKRLNLSSPISIL
jgi:carbamoyltransferase